MKCVRCPRAGHVLVHQVDTGDMQGPDPGARTGDIYACDEHATEIGREPGAWPWLMEQAEAPQPRPPSTPLSTPPTALHTA